MSRLSSSSGGGISIPAPSTYSYNEITNVAIGLETTIISFTATNDQTLLSAIDSSGGNIGEVKVYLNGNVIDKKYLYYTEFNLSFNFGSIRLLTGDTLAVRGVNNGQDVCNFNARIQLIGA